MFNILDELIKLVNYVDEGRRNHTREKGDSVEEVFGYLRGCVKYLLFERDAHKREIKYYRDLLEKRNQC